MGDFPGTPIIVLGMGRSGTSYLTNLLESLGVSLGRNLVPASSINPRGFFENEEIVHFHQSVLKRVRPGEDWDGPTGEILSADHLNNEEKERALALLGRLAGPGLWGWKDPRTVHFIGFWLSVLPAAKIIVPLRHPLEILYSYLKRLGSVDVLTDPEKVVRAFVAYHGAISAAIAARTGDSLVVYAPNAFTDPAGLGSALQHFLHLPEVQIGSTPSFHPDEFSRFSIRAEAVELFRRTYPDAAAAFSSLNKRALFRFVAEEEPRDENPAPNTWLPVLVDMCRPTGSPSYFALQRKALKQLQEAKQFWEAQAASLEKALVTHVALVQEQSSWIGKLEEAKQFWQGQAERAKK